MKENAIQAVDYMYRCMTTGLVPMLSGSPGIGKSDIVKQIAKKFNLELIDIRLSTMDPVDLTGLPMRIGDKFTWVPADLFPLAGKTDAENKALLPKGKIGWLLFFDEINSSTMAMQAAAYKTLLDKLVGQHKIHPNTWMAGAGNLSTDGAIVNRMGTAMQSRLIHLELAVELKPWVVWAYKNGIDHRIIAYLNKVPRNLHNFDPKHNDKTFACPRTYEFLSRLIKTVHTNDLRGMMALWAGTVSEGVANEFVGYTQIYNEIPDYPQIVKDPLNAKMGSDPSMSFAVAYLIASQIEKKDIKPVMQFLDRLEPEFRTIAMQGMCVTDPSIFKLPEVDKWYTKMGVDLL